MLVKVIYLTITMGPVWRTADQQHSSYQTTSVCCWAVLWLGAHANCWGALPISFTRAYQVGLAVRHAGVQLLPEPDGNALGVAGQSMGAGKISGNRHKML